VVAESEVAVVGVGVVQRAQRVVEDFCDIVGNEAQVRGKVLGHQLAYFPARKVCMPAVMEGIVVADVLRQWREQVRGAGDGRDIALDVAVEDDPRVSLDSPFVVAPGK